MQYFLIGFIATFSLLVVSDKALKSRRMEEQ